MDQPGPIVNAFTVDVEDYFHVTAFARDIPRDSWHLYPSRVGANTRRLLDLLEARGVRGTFFVLGWIGEHFPDVVRAIADAGHEIGCHSYWHRLVYQLDPDEFRRDLRQARAVLEDIVGERIVSFRAPTWSITRQSLWALDILAEEGFRHDSSIFPIFHDRYGIPDAHPFPHSIRSGPESLWEFPASVHRLGNWNLPISGGGYFRLYPASWTAHWLELVNRRHEQPFMFYIHPWELDPDQPRLPVGGRIGRWRHYLNLASTKRKLDWLLTRFHFGRLDEVLTGCTSSPETELVPIRRPLPTGVSECA